MKFLVLGLGSIGSRHIRNLKKLGYPDIIGYDADHEFSVKKSKELNIQITTDFKDQVDAVDAIIVCTPPSFHVEATIFAAEKNKYIFLEKPVSNDLEDAKRLLPYKDKIMVGYNVRYHPLIKYTKEILPNLGKIYNVQMEYAYNLATARPTMDYKKGYYAKKGEGGVLLDHIHEVDYAQYLFGEFKNVFCKAEKISNLEISSEDNANLILTSVKGFSLALHIDYIQSNYTRNIKIIAENGIFFCDYTTGIAQLTIKDQASNIKEFPPSFDQTYIDEIQDFITMVRDKSLSVIGLSSALKSQAIANAAMLSNKNNQVVDL